MTGNLSLHSVGIRVDGVQRSGCIKWILPPLMKSWIIFYNASIWRNEPDPYHPLLVLGGRTNTLNPTGNTCHTQVQTCKVDGLRAVGFGLHAEGFSGFCAQGVDFLYSAFGIESFFW